MAGRDGEVWTDIECRAWRDRVAFYETTQKGEFRRRAEEAERQVREIAEWLAGVGFGYDFSSGACPEFLIPILAEQYAKIDGESASDHEWALRAELGMER